ncbi:MAG: hypothetical protein AAGB04_14580 [Pseudomonadota bacterium]
MMKVGERYLLELAIAEVEALHAFISQWFRGELGRTSEVYQRGFTERLADNLVNIQPSGQVLTRADLLDPIEAAHGANPDFRISISDVTLRHISKDQTLIQATYVEHQTGARNTTPSDNDRISTVLFSRDPSTDRLTWLHLHETAVQSA